MAPFVMRTVGMWLGGVLRARVCYVWACGCMRAYVRMGGAKGIIIIIRSMYFNPTYLLVICL